MCRHLLTTYNDRIQSQTHTDNLDGASRVQHGAQGHVTWAKARLPTPSRGSTACQGLRLMSRRGAAVVCTKSQRAGSRGWAHAWLARGR